MYLFKRLTIAGGGDDDDDEDDCDFWRHLKPISQFKFTEKLFHIMKFTFRVRRACQYSSILNWYSAPTSLVWFHYVDECFSFLVAIGHLAWRHCIELMTNDYLSFMTIAYANQCELKCLHFSFECGEKKSNDRPSALWLNSILFNSAIIFKLTAIFELWAIEQSWISTWRIHQIAQNVTNVMWKSENSSSLHWLSRRTSHFETFSIRCFLRVYWSSSTLTLLSIVRAYGVAYSLWLSRGLRWRCAGVYSAMQFSAQRTLFLCWHGAEAQSASVESETTMDTVASIGVYMLVSRKPVHVRTHSHVHSSMCLINKTREI